MDKETDGARNSFNEFVGISKIDRLRARNLNDKRRPERDADQPIQFINSIKLGRPTSNNKFFKLINTDENTVKQNNFYFTKQQKKLQQMRPDNSPSGIQLSPSNDENSPVISDTPTSPSKIKIEDDPSPPDSKKTDKSQPKIRWRHVSSPNRESPSLAPQPHRPEQEMPFLPLSSNEQTPTIKGADVTYVLSPIPSNGPSNGGADAKSPPSEKGNLQQQQQHQPSAVPILDSNQEQQPQGMPFPPFGPFPPFYGAPYGMIPFPPPFPPYMSPSSQNQLNVQPFPYGPLNPGFPPQDISGPQMIFTPHSNTAYDGIRFQSRDASPIYETSSHQRNRSLAGSKSSRRKSQLSSSFVPPMPIFPPPPPARSGSNGPDLIPQYRTNPELERANILRLLDASKELPNVDTQFYEAVSSLEHLLSLKHKLEGDTGNDKDNNYNDNSNENDEYENGKNDSEADADQESETEEELAFMDRKMERYYFKKENDLDTYYNQIKYNRVAPYMLGKLTLEEEKGSSGKNLERGNTEMHDIESPKTMIDNGESQTIGADRRKLALLEDYENLNQSFNNEQEKIFEMKKAQLLLRIEAVQKGKDDEFNLEIADLEENRDFELLRLRNFRDFERNENLRLYYDDALYVYQELSRLISQKLSNLKNFLNYQKEIMGNDLDKDLLDISSVKSGRFIKSFGSNINSASTGQAIENPIKENLVVSIPSPMKIETSSSEAGDTSQSGSALIVKTKKVGRKKKQPPFQKKQKLSPAQQYQFDEYGPLLASAEFEFITDTTTNFYTKVIRYFENSSKFPNQQQQTAVSPATRSSKFSNNQRSLSKPNKKLSNLAKSIRDSNGFSGGLTNTNDYSLQLQKVMKLYATPARLKDDEILNDLKSMGKDTDKWVV